MDRISPPEVDRASGTAHAASPSVAHLAVARVLFGEPLSRELPQLVELTAAVTALASGQRDKCILPLATSPEEIALVRRGKNVLVSQYTTASAPEIVELHRPVDLRSLLDVCAHATFEQARHESDDTSRRIAQKLAARALETDLVERPCEAPEVLRGGMDESTRRDVPLAFGWEARIYPHDAGPSSRAVRADVHGLLFDGVLVAQVRGRRIALTRGPVMLPVLRMLAALRAMLEARESGRGANVRLRQGAFQVGMRLEASGEASITLRGESGASASGAELTLEEIARAVLDVAAELVRALVTTDRREAKNLRVRALRAEIRALRRGLAKPRDSQSFVNRDPDRLRASAPPEPAETARPQGAPAGALRFGERWRIVVDGLDASGTFLCGDRLVLSTSRHTLAIARDSGEVLWARAADDALCSMAGAVLLRAMPDGELELCSVRDGEPFATAKLGARTQSPTTLLVDGLGAPPTAVLTDGPDAIAAVDLRTGELRWRFAARHAGPLHVSRAGRLLLVASTDGVLHGVDAASGEEVWRYGTGSRFASPATVVRDRVFASTTGGSSGNALHAVDLFSGEPLFARALSGAPSCTPIAASARVLVATQRGGQSSLSAFDAEGQTAFEVEDVGLSAGAGAIVVDDMLVVNAPGGRVTGLSLRDGHAAWSHVLADPARDDVPRRLDPVLRGGAIFVPTSSVHVIRPHDGSFVGAKLDSDLVPDLLLVDERNWVYVGEESGHLTSHAPVPHLTLIRGGL